jgi:biopolymer transport protein TolR
MTDITLTPLIDTALTLLVIFMIAAPMMRNSINVRLPKGHVKEASDSEERIFVQIDKEGHLFVDGKLISRNAFLDSLKKEAHRSSITMVVVEADEQVGYGKVYDLVDAIKQLGVIDNVAMSSRSV